MRFADIGSEQGLSVNAGAIAQGPTSFPSSFTQFAFKQNDETRGATTPLDDADLKFTVQAGKLYQLRGLVVSTQTTDSVGANVIFTNGASLPMTFLAAKCYINRLRTAGGSAGTTTGADVESYKFQFLDASPWNPTGGATIAACQNYYDISVMFRPTNSGVLSLRWWPQAGTGPVTMKAGSYLELIETGV